MTRIALIALLVVGGCNSAFAACMGMPLPPERFQTAPRETLDLIFENPENVRFDCLAVGQHGTGCEWGYGGIIHVRLALGKSEYESCELRHALGHIAQYEYNGNPNAAHWNWHADQLRSD